MKLLISDEMNEINRICQKMLFKIKEFERIHNKKICKSSSRL